MPPPLSPIQQQMFDTLMQHAKTIVETPGMTEAQAATIRTQMQADMIKQQQERTQLRQELNVKILDMSNETYVNRVKTSDKAQKAVLDYVRS